MPAANAPHDPLSDHDWIAGYLGRLAAAPRQTRHGGLRSGLLALLRSHGQPQQYLNAVRITGSKGKGSTALIMESALTRAGVHVGVFTSPHLQRWNERIRINGDDVPPADLAAVLRMLEPEVDALRNDPDIHGPDFFEVCLAAALILFVRARCDIVILESGIGARGDATAVVRPVLSVITTIELEHAELIGPRLIDVAWEKSGVIHHSIPVIAGRMATSPLSVLKSVAADEHAPLSQFGREFRIRRGGDSTVLLYEDAGGGLALPVDLSLLCLAESVAVALAAVRRLPGIPVGDEALVNALRNLKLSGRLEMFSGAPPLVADGAHTRASSALLARMLCRYLHTRSGTLVISCSRGHDPRALDSALWSWAAGVVVTRADARRARPPQATAAALRHCFRGAVTVEPDPQRALRRALQTTPANALVCATGSVYMAGQARTFAQSRR